jgi:hypothetical protein
LVQYQRYTRQSYTQPLPHKHTPAYTKTYKNTHTRHTPRAAEEDPAGGDQEDEDGILREQTYYLDLVSDRYVGKYAKLSVDNYKLGVCRVKRVVGKDDELLNRDGCVVQVGYALVDRVTWATKKGMQTWDFTGGHHVLVSSDGTTSFSTTAEAIAAECSSYYVFGQLLCPNT